MSVRDLKQMLRDKKVDYSKCVEKAELVALAEEHLADGAEGDAAGGADTVSSSAQGAPPKAELINAGIGHR